MRRLPARVLAYVAVDDAIALVGADTPGGHRLVETAEFLRFTRADLDAMPRRWAAYREEQRAGTPAGGRPG